MVNVFGDSIASGPRNLQVGKKVVVTVGKSKDHIDEIQQSYVLGFSPYRLHKNADGTFVTPIRVYDGKVYVLDNVATMEFGDRDLITDRINSKLVYLGSSGIALQGGPSGARSLKGDSGDKGPVGNRGSTGKRRVEGPEVGSRGGIGQGDTGVVGPQGPIGPQCSPGPRGVQGAKHYVELLVSKVVLEWKDLLVLLVDTVNVA